MNPPQFEWDEQKAVLNRSKHGVSFEEAASVFADPLAAIFDDEAHLEDEYREIIVGRSDHNRLLLVSFTERDEVVRLISARRATEKERRNYDNRTRR